jgi:Kef-type K+ transport system membrane component KefB/predicted transcriptional regulator
MNDLLHQGLLLFGMAMFFGLSGGKIFRFFKIPQVVGYIAIGIVLGVSGFGIFDRETIRELGPFTDFALGVIGFMIGGEIRLSTFKKYGRNIFVILICEGMFAYILVGLFVYALTKNVALSILLAALASATAPAATVDVIWEYRAKGILSTMILAIVALDDGLSLILYALSKVFAESFVTGKTFSFLHSITQPLIELGSTALLGVITGLAVYLLLKRIHEIKERESFLIISLGAVLVTTGLASVLHLDMILSNMVLGVTLINVGPRRSHFLFNSTKQIAAPVYVVFFVLVGARLEIAALGGIGLIGIVYLMGRTAGKIGGVYIGSLITKADERVKKYLGTSLFSQAGVAIGLAIAIDHSFAKLGPAGSEIGHLIINVITATTFIVQLVGPPSVRWSLKKAGEMWRGMSEEEILDAHRVDELMTEHPKAILESESHSAVIRRIKNSEYVYFPVVDGNNNFVGAIQLDHIRSVLFEESLDFIRAIDMAVLEVSTIAPHAKLTEAKQLFDFEEYDYLPVIDGRRKLKGILTRRSMKKFIKRKLWEAESS